MDLRENLDLQAREGHLALTEPQENQESEGRLENQDHLDLPVQWESLVNEDLPDHQGLRVPWVQQARVVNVGRPGQQGHGATTAHQDLRVNRVKEDLLAPWELQDHRDRQVNLDLKASADHQDNPDSEVRQDLPVHLDLQGNEAP